MRGVLGELMVDSDGRDVIVDMEAGLEHPSRDTGRYVDLMLAVVEPYYRALETGKRVVDLARDLEVGRVAVVSNKVRDEEDREGVAEFCDRHGLEIVAEVPYDRRLIDAGRSGRAPVDFDPASPAVRAVRELAAKVV